MEVVEHTRGSDDGDRPGHGRERGRGQHRAAEVRRFGTTRQAVHLDTDTTDTE